MPVKMSVGCPFGCDGLVKIDKNMYGECSVCGADVFSTTSKERIRIIDSFVAQGALSLEISQVIDYSYRKKVPKEDNGSIIFALRNLKYA